MTTTRPAPPDWDELLRSKGLRVTSPRLTVMDALWRLPHSSAEQIVQHGDPELSFQSVYNVLADLGAVKLVRSLELPHQPGRYELDFGDNHHHACCTECGAVFDVPCAVGHAPCLTPANDHGMTIQIADVLYRGLCSDCRQTTNPTTTGDVQ